MIGWDHPDTASNYDAFCAAHPRYRGANESLAWHAGLAPHHHVLDLGAGIGGTSEAALQWLSDAGRVVAFEPAEAMRNVGRRRVSDPRVRWVDACPEGPFDRILCGAAIWQMLPIEHTIRELASRLSAGGALCFNIPSSYLGEPDSPGGGSDANLHGLPALLGAASNAIGADPLPAPSAISDLLRECGLQVERWRFRQPLTQQEYRDWLKIPVLTNHWFGPLDAAERARRIDLAFRGVDRDSWRWEAWSGWTAWRPPAPPSYSLPSHQPLTESQLTSGDLSRSGLAARAETDGYLYFRGLLEPDQLEPLKSRVAELHRRQPVPPGAAYDDPRFLDLQRAVALLPEWDALRRHPAILEALHRPLGQDIRAECGDVCRVVAPRAPGSATPPHQDQFFVRQASRIWTVWIPLDDCPLRLGPLVVLPGSHRQGIQPHIENRVADANTSGWWAASSMSCGDVLMFDGCAVHRACPNLTCETVRFSADFRYSRCDGRPGRASNESSSVDG
ncbi:MAG: phytanoyl-CoA dioxygenase family protein [Bryobacteraceae bacterium]|nr:phytanoyl-CoA dioxygenase family protein [Bryobacteraceae bacterium]